jgi:hypothetical protein
LQPDFSRPGQLREEDALSSIYAPPLAQVLGLVPPDLAIWGVILGMSFAPIVALRIVAPLPGRLN